MHPFVKGASQVIADIPKIEMQNVQQDPLKKARKKKKRK